MKKAITMVIHIMPRAPVSPTDSIMFVSLYPRKSEIHCEDISPSGGEVTFSWVPKRIPRIGITKVIETKPKRTDIIFNKALSSAKYLYL